MKFYKNCVILGIMIVNSFEFDGDPVDSMKFILVLGIPLGWIWFRGGLDLKSFSVKPTDASISCLRVDLFHFSFIYDCL